MNQVLAALEGKLVVSCQPVRGGPLDHANIVTAYASAVASAGAAAVRIEGRRDLTAVLRTAPCPVIGLIKRDGNPEDATITATEHDLDWLLVSDAHIVALEGTRRASDIDLVQAVRRIHTAGKLAMVDISTLDEGLAAWEAGADLVGTTLSGYTSHSRQGNGPDIALVSELAHRAVRVMAEGRYDAPSLAGEARHAGAYAVTVGSAITRAEIITGWYADALATAQPG